MSAEIPFAVLAVGGAARAAAAHARSLLADAGHDAPPPQVVEPAGLAAAVRAAATSHAVVVVVGGLGVGPADRTRAALRPVLQRAIAGFGELYRLVSFRDVGPDALLHDALAGYAGPALVVAVPADDGAVERALSELLLPTLPALLAGADPTAAAADAPAEADADDLDDLDLADAPDATEELDAPRLPAPEPRWRLGLPRVVTEGVPIEATPPVDAEGDEVPDRGWKRAVYDLEAAVVRGVSADTPQNLEDFAPFMELLHQAGERARLDLPSGVKYDLYGFPDLQRANSKVLAIGWGEPLAEVIALHRYPVQAGLCIEEARGLMPGRGASVADVAVAVTGRAPADTSGELFAVDHDAVYIQRGKWIFRWDGRRERQEGNPKQTLVTLALGWHGR
jgi:molybdenum cofactor biosynthesis protein B